MSASNRFSAAAMSRVAPSVRSVGVRSGARRRTFASLTFMGAFLSSQGGLHSSRKLQRGRVYVGRNAELSTEARIFSLMRVSNGAPKPLFQLAAIKHHFFCFDGNDRGKRHREVAGVFDIDHQLRPAMRR